MKEILKKVLISIGSLIAMIMAGVLIILVHSYRFLRNIRRDKGL